MLSPQQNCSLCHKKQNIYYKLIKENSGHTVAVYVQFTPKDKLELITLASRKLHLVTHKENLKFKSVAETTFNQWKVAIMTSVSLNQLF